MRINEYERLVDDDEDEKKKLHNFCERNPLGEESKTGRKASAIMMTCVTGETEVEKDKKKRFQRNTG